MPKDMSVEDKVLWISNELWKAGATGQGLSVSSAYSMLMNIVNKSVEDAVKVAMEQEPDNLEDI